MAAYRRVYGFGHLPADCRGPGSSPESYARFKYYAFMVFPLPSAPAVVTRTYLAEEATLAVSFARLRVDHRLRNSTISSRMLATTPAHDVSSEKQNYSQKPIRNSEENDTT